MGRGAQSARDYLQANATHAQIAVVLKAENAYRVKQEHKRQADEKVNLAKASLTDYVYEREHKFCRLSGSRYALPTRAFGAGAGESWLVGTRSPTRLGNEAL